MKVLIVHANLNTNSFTSALKDRAIEILKKKGHVVKVSDLYELGFDPVAKASDVGLKEGDDLHYMMAQRDAFEKKTISKDILKEQEKVKWADLIIFNYPIWWASTPAMMKGWLDRILSLGFAWGFGAVYDKGLLKGKKAMLAVTTGGPKEMYDRNGGHKANINDILHPVNWGTLKFCGMDVLPPFIAWTVFQAGDEGRKKYLKDYSQIIENIEKTKPMY